MIGACANLSGQPRFSVDANECDGPWERAYLNIRSEAVMSDWFRNAAWATVLGSAVAAGCQHATGPDAYPKDPLLLSKKPVEGLLSPLAPPQVQLAAGEPTPPRPSEALAAAFQPRAQLATGRGTIAAQPVVRDRGPTLATPAVRSSAVFGHAPDHRWLMGVLSRHDQGHFDLRFRDASEEDPFGGKVSLAPDPRLEQFQDGDVVRVEGELATGATEPGKSRSHYARYRIRDVKLLQRKN